MEAAANARLKPPLYVVGITARTAAGQAVQGTGFIVSEHGHVATCKHVVYADGDGQPVHELRVKLPYPAEKPYAYRVVGSSGEDLALLESTVPVDFPLPQALLPAERTHGVQVGDAVTVWGYSAAEHYTSAQRFDANVSGLSGEYGRIGLAVDINPGDSGGPVLDRERYVVGIVHALDERRAGQAMAIPVSLLQVLLRDKGVAAGPSSDASGIVSLAPLPPEHAFVGRAQLLVDLKRQLATGRHVALCFRPGVGKSALAIALANDRDLRVRFDGGVLWTSLNRNPNVLSELQKWAAALQLPIEQMNQLRGMVPDQQADEAKVEHEATRQWAQALSQVIGERRMLLVIDDAWEIGAAKAMLLNAPNCGRVVTTREQYKVAESLGERFETTVVEELTAGDAFELLRQLAPDAVDMYPDEARKIYPAVGGLPQALLLLGMHLGQESRGARRRRILDAYHDIQANLDKHLKPLHAAIDISYNALPDNQTRWALQALSVFRPKPHMFSEEAAVAVLEKEASLIDNLHDSGLIETVHLGPDPHDLPYTMHREIAEYGRDKLKDEALTLHRRAAAHFSKWLKEYEQAEQDPSSYAYQYRYEHPQWQDAMDDYLYHLARSGDSSSAILDFGSIYFNAFWWWGCYVEFSFSTRLLKQAASKRLNESAREALALLVSFDAAYPKETERGNKAGDWNEVLRVVTKLRRLGRLDGDIGVGLLADADARRTRAITDTFLAEAYRFGHEDVASAERWYRDAIELLDESDWSKPWVLYYLGDLYLDAGRLDDAAQTLADCLALAEDPELIRKDRDNEVLGNAYRVRAELAWRGARHDEVIESCERAVLHAYAFQAIPVPPDPYTVAFYRQLSGRIAGLLQTMHRKEPARALAHCSRLRDYWSSYRELAQVANGTASQAQVEAMLRSNANNELCAYLFPPAPAPHEMYQRGSRYFNEAITILNEKMGGV